MSHLFRNLQTKLRHPKVQLTRLFFELLTFSALIPIFTYLLLDQGTLFIGYKAKPGVRVPDLIGLTCVPNREVISESRIPFIPDRKKLR